MGQFDPSSEPQPAQTVAMTPDQHIERAAYLLGGKYFDTERAVGHALVAIAQILSDSSKRR